MNPEMQMIAESMSNYNVWKDAVASNIGGVSRIGNRDTKVAFEEALGEAGAKLVSNYNFTVGKAISTGNPTDLAIDGQKGFFGFEGGKVLSRDGEFHWNAQNTLVNKHGQPVEGEGGPIVKTMEDGHVDFDRSGNVLQGGKVIGKLALYTVADPSQLARTEGGFAGNAKSGVSKLPAEEVRVLPGSLEASNGSSMHSMVELMRVSNSYQLSQQAIKNADQRMGLAIQSLGGRT